ncbi:MAG: hypothetical protein V4541_10435 [Bacteroidota bacterium]
MAETEPSEGFSETSSSITFVSPDGNKRIKDYQWLYAGNPLSGYKVWSHVTGTHKKVGTDWEWDDIKHDNFSVSEKPSYMTVTVTLNGTPVPTMGTTAAEISVKCSIEASVIFKGSPFGYPSKDFNRNSPIFYVD